MDNKYIGILTSGGDASGMNAAIRAVTRAAIFNVLNIVSCNKFSASSLSAVSLYAKQCSSFLRATSALSKSNPLIIFILEFKYPGEGIP